VSQNTTAFKIFRIIHQEKFRQKSWWGERIKTYTNPRLQTKWMVSSLEKRTISVLQGYSTLPREAPDSLAAFLAEITALKMSQSYPSCRSI